MSEAFVSLETAKLLKELGYPQEGRSWWTYITSTYYHEYLQRSVVLPADDPSSTRPPGRPQVAAPTPLQALDWLEQRAITTPPALCWVRRRGGAAGETSEWHAWGDDDVFGDEGITTDTPDALIAAICRRLLDTQDA